MMEERIKNRKAKIGIIGLGYVGLPLAVEFASAGFSVTGFEVDGRKVKDINVGTSYIPDVPSDKVSGLVKAGRFSGTTDFKKLSGMDAVIVCVPTPLRKSKDPDIRYILSATDKVQAALRKGQLIVLESTTYPGTTREILLPAFESRGFRVGKDFFLAFSPERVDPGNKRFSIRNTPKVVGGVTPLCARYAQALYGSVVEKIVPVSSPEAAELVKLLENTFRAVNIGLANEMALICDQLKLNVWEVIQAAATKPFGFMPFYPGPGLGGHCIPLDPHYLAWKLKTFNFYARFIELAGEINSHMPEHVVRKTGDALNRVQKSVSRSRILVLGVTYKKDIDDARESPAVDVIEKLLQKEARVEYHDPYVPRLKAGEHEMKSRPLTDALLRSQDCVIITTDHSRFDIPRIVRNSRLVVDTRNACKGLDSPKIVRL